MSRSIFDIFKGGTKGRRAERSRLSAQASSEHDSGVVSPQPEITIDEQMVALSQELSALNTISVPRAAKERGWAALERELERRPVRAAAGAGRTATSAAATRHAGGVGRAYRLTQNRVRLGIVAAAAVAVVCVGVVLGTSGGGDIQMAGTDSTTNTSAVDSGTTVPETVAPDTTEAAPSSTAPDSSVDTQVDTTDGAVNPDSTEASQADTTTGGSTPVTSDSSAQTTTPTTPGTSGGSATTARPTTQTTRPPATTADTQNASAQREGNAKAAVAYLAQGVIVGDTSGVRSLVASGTQPSLAQLMMSLDDPFGYRVGDVRTLTSDTVRVTLQFDDRVVSGSGEFEEVSKTFFVRVRVTDDGALITAINAGS